MAEQAPKKERAPKADKAPKKPAKKSFPMLIGAVLLVVVLIVVGKGMMGKGKDQKPEKKKKSTEVGITMPLDEFLVNLNGGGDHYLRTTVALGLTKTATEEESKEKSAMMRDAILTVLSAKSLKDLSNNDGKDSLKDELKTKVNEAIGDELVVKVYFTAFATQ